MGFLSERIRSFFYGFTLPLRSLRLILKTRILLVWSLVPIALTLALSVWGVTWAKAKLVVIGMAWLESFGFAQESLTVRAAMILLQIVLFVLAAVSFSLLAGVLASPLNDFLAESTEAHCDSALPALPTESHTWGWRVRAVWIDVVKTVIIAGIQICLIFVGVLAFWLPGLNMIPFLAAFWLLTYQFVGYPQTRRGQGFLASLPFLYRHFFACLGFGIANGVLFAVPLLSAFALPLAVVGGTLLFARAQPHPLLTPLR